METEIVNSAKTGMQKDTYAIINERIIEQLSKGIVPWHKLWDTTGPPTNLITKKTYRGINTLLLGMEEYQSNLFLTFDQVNSIGGKVKKGSKGHPVVYWRKPQASEGTEGRSAGSLEYYMVFNIAQCEKIPVQHLPAQTDAAVCHGYEDIVEHMPNSPQKQHKAVSAYYDPVEDIIHLPKKSGSKKVAEYHAMVFAQLVHSTGHDSRLARKGLVEMSENSSEPLYSKEDLIGEIGVCFLMSTTGLSMQFKGSPRYMQGWLGKLKSDNRLVCIAAAEAQKAVDYILNVKREAEDPIL